MTENEVKDIARKTAYDITGNCDHAKACLRQRGLPTDVVKGLATWLEKLEQRLDELEKRSATFS